MPNRAKCESKKMIARRTQTDNTTEKMIEEFRDTVRRKRRTVEHIERAIARHYARQELADSAPRFRRGEVNHG
jgi:hypothetical protein